MTQQTKEKERKITSRIYLEYPKQEKFTNPKYRKELIVKGSKDEINERT
jgi:hypothetical protein